MTRDRKDLLIMKIALLLPLLYPWPGQKTMIRMSLSGWPGPPLHSVVLTTVSQQAMKL